MARAAGVDAALVHHCFGSKDGLFLSAFARTEFQAVQAVDAMSDPAGAPSELLVIVACAAALLALGAAALRRRTA